VDFSKYLDLEKFPVYPEQIPGEVELDYLEEKESL